MLVCLPDFRFFESLMQPINAGQSTAQKWYANGCRTLDDLKNGKSGVKLSSAQGIGLKFYDGTATPFIPIVHLLKITCGRHKHPHA